MPATLSRASFLPDTDQLLAGVVEFEPIEGGGLLVMRQIGDPSHPPAASWVIGRDSSRETYSALYTDSRGVPRVYEMSVDMSRGSTTST